MLYKKPALPPSKGSLTEQLSSQPRALTWRSNVQRRSRVAVYAGKNDMKMRNMNESRADRGPCHQVPLGNVDFDHSKQGCYNEVISALT